MVATQLVDEPWFVLVVAFVSGTFGAVASYEYGAWRERRSTKKPAANSGPRATVAKGHTHSDQSQVFIDQSRTHIDRSTQVTVNQPPAAPPLTQPSGVERAVNDFADWVDREAPASLFVVFVGALLFISAVAAAYVEWGRWLVWALAVLGGACAGAALGAWLRLRRYPNHADDDWRRQLAVAAVLSAVTAADAWLLKHPHLATGTLKRVMEPFSKDGLVSVMFYYSEEAGFLALQAFGAVIALGVCACALAKTVAVWANTHANRSGRPPRFIRTTAATWPALVVAAVIAALVVSGLVANLIGLTPLTPPELTQVHLVKRSVDTVRANVSEPATLRGEVRRRRHNGLATAPAQVKEAECPQGGTCVLHFDAATLRPGRYRVQVAAIDWTSTQSKPSKLRYRRR